jgi:hypothetical protein
VFRRFAFREIIRGEKVEGHFGWCDVEFLGLPWFFGFGNIVQHLVLWR